MYMIQITNNGTNPINAGRLNLDVGVTILWPADQAYWSITPNAEGYRVTNLHVFSDAGTFTELPSVHTTLLGYIGKSGRFVAISN